MAVVRNKIKVNGWNIGGNYSSYTQQGRFFRGLFAGDVIGMDVKQASNLGMDIEIHQGSAILTKNTHSAVMAEIQDTILMTVPTADQSNPRVDVVVVYEDGAVVIPENIDEYWQDGNGGRFKVAIITGTASATPSGATDSEISRALNTTTYAKLAEVRVEARTTTITQGNITDLRTILEPSRVSARNVDWTTVPRMEYQVAKDVESISVTPKYNCTIEVVFACGAWGYNAAEWIFSMRENNNKLVQDVIQYGIVTPGSNGVRRQASTRCIFRNAKAGQSYRFIVHNNAGSPGGWDQRRSTVLMHPDYS